MYYIFKKIDVWNSPYVLDLFAIRYFLFITTLFICFEFSRLLEVWLTLGNENFYCYNKIVANQQIQIVKTLSHLPEIHFNEQNNFSFISKQIWKYSKNEQRIF